MCNSPTYKGKEGTQNCLSKNEFLPSSPDLSLSRTCLFYSPSKLPLNLEGLTSCRGMMGVCTEVLQVITSPRKLLICLNSKFIFLSLQTV